MTMFQYYKRSRHFVFSAFIAFVFVLLCQNTAFARASSNGDLPTKADLQAQLDSLNKQKDLSAQDKLVQQDLTDTLATLDKIDRVKEETVQLRQKVAEAPEKMRQATAALTALSDVDNDEETRKILSTLSLRQLETRVAQALDDLQNAQNDLASYNSQLVSLQTQPERVQNAMYNASQQLQQIRSRLDGTDVGETALRPSQKVLMQVQQALLNAEIDQQRKSLEGNTVLQDTLQKQRDYVTANSARLEHQLQLLQEAVNSKRLTLTEKTAQEAVSPDEAARIQANPLVKQELEINQQLSQRLITATQNGNQLMQQNIKVKNWLERALQSERNIKEQIAVLKGSLLLSRILYQQHIASGLNALTCFRFFPAHGGSVPGALHRLPLHDAASAVPRDRSLVPDGLYVRQPSHVAAAQNPDAEYVYAASGQFSVVRYPTRVATRLWLHAL